MLKFIDDDGTEYEGAEAERKCVEGRRRIEARRAALTPEQVALRERFYRESHDEYLRLSADKRRQGHGDCTPELEEARRIVAERIAAEIRRPSTASPLVAPAVRRTAPRPRGAGRPAARRTSSSRSNCSSSDDPGPGNPEPPAGLTLRWHSEHGRISAALWRLLEAAETTR